MGAQEFTTVGRGKTAAQAFRNAVKQAQYEYGHAGYSGTIAEKVDFTVIDVPPDLDPGEYAEDLLNQGDERIDDKWGPAGCVKLGTDTYLFFGWASS